MQVPQRKQCTLIEALHLVVLALPMLALAEFTDPRQTVDAHNQKRALHRVPALRWDDNLARFAESLVSNCKFKHSGGKYGENLHASSEGRASINDAVNAWYNEIKFYDFRNPAFSLQTSHFTAVVWKNTQRVGCAYATNCPGKWETVLACEYDSPGNVIGDFQNNVLSPGNQTAKMTPVLATHELLAVPAVNESLQVISYNEHNRNAVSRSLLQAGVCTNGLYYVTCNAAALCSPPFAECRPDGIEFCLYAYRFCRERGGNCVEQDGSTTRWISANFNYFDMYGRQLGGAVFCDPPPCSCSARFTRNVCDNCARRGTPCMCP
eukprot:jgi/Botrbrau1/4355/Bobra.105_2s0004.1